MDMNTLLHYGGMIVTFLFVADHGDPPAQP